MLELIAESLDGAARVRRIVQDLRDFSRPGETEWQFADLQASLESTLNVVWNEIKYKADVVRDYAELPPVECLPGQLNQVFLNLLVNAAQAIPERGVITLRTRCAGDFVRISVEDTAVAFRPRSATASSTPSSRRSRSARDGARAVGDLRHRREARRRIEVEARRARQPLLVCLPVSRPAGAPRSADAGAERGSVRRQRQRTRNTLPRPGSLSTSMRPPCS
jgi:light-regulated signal transduction histidine kinase (bacteriophytochrome)